MENILKVYVASEEMQRPPNTNWQYSSAAASLSIPT